MEAPTPLTEAHQTAGFSCGAPSLDEWLVRRAWANQVSGASRTYVVADSGRVVGYCGLASGALAAIDAPGGLRRNMPDPIPMAILGRLAIAQDWQGHGIGVALLRDAAQRTQAASTILGIRGLLVHALSEPAASFYRHYGFIASPTRPLTLVMSLKTLSSARG